MELEHRFEVPVGLDDAWGSLLDMDLVASCFPGATLKSSDGEEYTGSVKVKLGPIQLTYQGSARITEKDASAHRATIEASGKAARSGSTASMTVVATASEVSADRTAVEMKTDLTITGRPAQFGRGVMADVGDKILGQFADCLAGKLAGPGESDGDGSGSDEADSAKTGGDQSATGKAGAAKQSADKFASGGTPTKQSSTATSATSAAAKPSTPRQTYTRSPEPDDAVEPIDLLGSAGAPVVKRLAPVAGGVALFLLIWMVLRRRKH